MWFKIFPTALKKYLQTSMSSKSHPWLISGGTWQLLSASHNQEGKITVIVQLPSSGKKHQKRASGGTGWWSLLWFDPKTTPWTQPQKAGQESLDFCSSKQQSNQHRSLLPQTSTDGFSLQEFPSQSSICVFAYMPLAQLTLTMVIYLALVSYRMSHQSPHQKLLNTHPSSSQKNKSKKTQKGPVWCRRQSRERSKKVHGHQSVAFSASEQHLGYATLETSALPMPS